MKARKHSRQRLEIERHPRHEVKYEEESGLVKKSLLKEEKLSVSHSFIKKDNHAHIAQVRNRSTSSDQIVVKDENSKQVKMKTPEVIVRLVLYLSVVKVIARVSLKNIRMFHYIIVKI